MNSLGQPRVFGSVYQEDPLLFTSKVFLSQTEMATTVGATLASAKLAVTQGDLHLVGSPVDQLVLYFDQAAFDKFLVTARVKANKPKRHRHQARITGVRYILTASSPHGGPFSHQRRAASVPDDGPISTSVWSRIGHPAVKIGTAEGPSYPRLGSCNVDHHDRRQRTAERLEPSRRPVRYYNNPRDSSQPAAQARSAGLKARATLVPSLLKGAKPQATGRASASQRRGKIPFEGKSQHALGDVKPRQRPCHPQKDRPHKAQTAAIAGSKGH